MNTASLSPRQAFDMYAQSLNAAEKTMSFWNDMFRTSNDFAWWWTQRWLDTPKAFMSLAAASPRLARKAAKASAAVIDLAEAAAERAASVAAETMDVAAQAQVIVAERTAEVAEAVVDESAVVVETVAEELKPEAQDLTLLVGIGPKLAAALAERGVTRFSHIAAWTEAELVELDKALDLKGRAVRDAWVAQAKRLAAEG